jgi:hypothetical protein
MKRRDWLFHVLALIAGATIVSGALQVVAPAFVLRTVGAETTPASCHFFGIVGMFMMLFGGAMLHALLDRANHPIVVLWAALQKLGAFAAVGLGVMNGVFGSLALLIAAFDLLSGVLALGYWQRIRRL